MTAQNLNVQFQNQTQLNAEDVYISIQVPPGTASSVNVTLSDGTPVSFSDPKDIMSVPVSLKTIGSKGLTVTTLSSGIFYVSYGAALQSKTAAPSFIGSGGTDYDTPFQPFELTRTGNPGDQGDMTAINYFTAPMGIESYTGGTSGTKLQHVQYTKDTATIAAQLKALTNSDPASVITSGSSIVRIIGPSSFAPSDTNPFPSLIDYVQSVAATGQTTKIVNNNAFNVPAAGGPGSTNYNFTLNLVATTAADGSIQMSGDITTTVTPYGGASSTGQTFQNCTVAISAADLDNYNYTLYGQVPSESVTFSGGWTALETYMQSIGLGSQGAYGVTQRLAVGEISSGLLMGFLNSSYVPEGHTTALKDMESCQWWELAPVKAFADIQPDHAYYNTYANVLYGASGNEVYSIPYSDRLGSGPLVNAVQYNGADVDTWVVTLGPPVSTL
ncbi:hypothetical protein E1180_01690 [Roseibium denhamense]|uniref:GH64 domain-containing protein n=1 Tax=Roseibium denhamense TaxID=76305 RepID=A0ABY1PM63_9HYPH|nr:hypothetical protein [Roseibium denhamense]MTI04228.1 hypothetical protein [Roseibium denhamense]SMP36862.1 hypothetical protein SAMN06265374_4345 [Roseibium denhamense]